MKKSINIILFPFITLIKGFNYFTKIISKGFYFYFATMVKLLNFIFKSDKLIQLENYFRRKEDEPGVLVLSFIYAVIIVIIIGMIYVPNQNQVSLSAGFSTGFGNDSSRKVNDSKVENSIISKYVNLYQYYGQTSLNDINIKKLKEKVNNDVVAWLSIDGTNVNYPITQSNDNDYYLNHSIKKTKTTDGWTFMDYRNNSDMLDKNTIFYGHNLLNKTAFGSVGNLFTDRWYNTSNHKIMVLTQSNKYIYEVFSVYYSEPVVDYLKVSFQGNEYIDFINNLKSKSLYNFDVDLSSSNSIITLSTCTEDNMGRKVVHASLISKESI